MADPQDNPNCDVPICYQMQSKLWGRSISSVICCPEFISQLKLIPHSSQVINFIKAYSDHVMQFLQMGDQIFHAALVWVPQSLFPCHPVQGQLSVPDYNCKVHYFYLMESLIEDQKADYDLDYTQDLYIANMNYSAALMEEMDKD